MQQSFGVLLLACSLLSAYATPSQGPYVGPYVLNKTDTKCAHRNSDRLFRIEDVDVEGCYNKCSSTDDCNYFSVALAGQYTGVCMGCKVGMTDPHDDFNFYTMAAETVQSSTASPSPSPPSEGPYVLNKTDTKCALGNNDRLFRIENVDVEGCYSKCDSTADCNYFSIALEGQYAGVCMGCKVGISEPHEKFNFYTMGAETVEPPVVSPSVVGLVLNESDCEPNTKCAHNHPDRLFRMEGSNVQDCFTECSNVESCNYFSIAEEGPYAGVCMGCMEGVTQPHQYFKFYTMPRANPVQDELAKCTEMPYEERVDCGWWGVTPEQCMEKGCCWQVDPVPNPNHYPYCYRHHTALPQCDVENSAKTDCGYFGIGADECEQRGCCYRASPSPNPDNIPYCYPPLE